MSLKWTPRLHHDIMDSKCFKVCVVSQFAVPAMYFCLSVVLESLQRRRTDLYTGGWVQVMIPRYPAIVEQTAGRILEDKNKGLITHILLLYSGFIDTV